MFRYLGKKLLQSAFTLFLVITVVFMLMRLMPEEGYFNNYDKLSETQRETMLTNMGLRDPMHIQLGRFYKDLAHLDFGESIKYRPKVPVSEIIKDKIPYSLAFGLGAIAISLLIGLPLGVMMARSKGKFWDKLGTGYIVFINAVPAAVYFLFIQLYATGAFRLPILFSKDKPASWVLPVISMSLGSIAGYAMWMRRYMVDELNKDYIRLARAKGMKSTEIMFKHVMRNAIIPMVQYLPSSILLTIMGSFYIESLYSIPGMGGLLIDAIQRQDNPLVQALVLIFSALSILGLFLGDIAMGLVDPRIKLDKKEGAR